MQLVPQMSEFYTCTCMRRAFCGGRRVYVMKVSQLDISHLPTTNGSRHPIIRECQLSISLHRVYQFEKKILRIFVVEQIIIIYSLTRVYANQIQPRKRHSHVVQCKYINRMCHSKQFMYWIFCSLLPNSNCILTIEICLN